MTWIDWGIGASIAIIGLFIFYRALKEPLDDLGRVISVGLIAIKNWIVGSTIEKTEVIKYG